MLPNFAQRFISTNTPSGGKFHLGITGITVDYGDTCNNPQTQLAAPPMMRILRVVIPHHVTQRSNFRPGHRPVSRVRPWAIP